ncbi:hypothetical protein J7L13_01705 [bacterium]|nr:hypothetical protein [bacterium]
MEIVVREVRNKIEFLGRFCTLLPSAHREVGQLVGVHEEEFVLLLFRRWGVEKIKLLVHLPPSGIEIDHGSFESPRFLQGDRTVGEVVGEKARHGWELVAGLVVHFEADWYRHPESGVGTTKIFFWGLSPRKFLDLLENEEVEKEVEDAWHLIFHLRPVL